MIEFELRKPVAEWLLSRGLSPVLECACVGHCDLVGVRFIAPNKFAEAVAVELKLRDLAGVRRQCERIIARKQVNEVWAAMPFDFAERHAEYFPPPIGLLGVRESECVVLETAQRMEAEFYGMRSLYRRRKEYEWRIKNPNMLRFVAAMKEQP